MPYGTNQVSSTYGAVMCGFSSHCYLDADDACAARRGRLCAFGFAMSLRSDYSIRVLVMGSFRLFGQHFETK